MNAPRTYERITGRDHVGRRYTVILRDVTESGIFVCGDEVDVEGQLVERGGALQRHLIHRDTITRRTPLVMSNKYGRLGNVGRP